MNQVRLPSVFELIACDKLKDKLREAFIYLLENLNYPGGEKPWFIPRPEELTLILDFIIEYNYLRAYNASYVEKLYGLTRCSGGSSMPIKQVLPSLICLTTIPYLRRKIEKYHERLNYKDSRTENELLRIRIYRLLTHSSSFLSLIAILRYAGGRSNYHNILNILTRISLRGRFEDEDDLRADGFSSKTVADFLGRALTVCSYVIQFMDYWSTHNNSTPLFGSSLKTPEPPSRDDLAYTDERSSGICLICGHVRQNECALSNTGYVFCYSCIYRYVKSRHKCPITGHPATIDNIVKLFTSVPS